VGYSFKLAINPPLHRRRKEHRTVALEMLTMEGEPSSPSSTSSAPKTMSRCARPLYVARLDGIGDVDVEVLRVRVEPASGGEPNGAIRS
jgi:hypothetical protein